MSGNAPRLTANSMKPSRSIRTLPLNDQFAVKISVRARTRIEVQLGGRQYSCEVTKGKSLGRRPNYRHIQRWQSSARRFAASATSPTCGSQFRSKKPGQLFPEAPLSTINRVRSFACLGEVHQPPRCAVTFSGFRNVATLQEFEIDTPPDRQWHV